MWLQSYRALRCNWYSNISYLLIIIKYIPKQFFFFNFLMYPKWLSKKRFSQIWLQDIYENKNSQNIFLYFWLHNWTMYKNMVIFLLFWSNFDYWKSQKTLNFSTFNFNTAFGYVEPTKKSSHISNYKCNSNFHSFIHILKDFAHMAI
jgi:hypothetical protein